MAETLFKNCDTNKDGSISFQEFAMTLYFLTHASKEEKLKHIFILLDADGNGTLSSTEVSIFCKLYVITYFNLKTDLQYLEKYFYRLFIRIETFI